MRPDEFAERLASFLRERPSLFSELLRQFPEIDYRTFLLGWSELRTKYQLNRDAEGRYLMKA